MVLNNTSPETLEANFNAGIETRSNVGIGRLGPNVGIEGLGPGVGVEGYRKQTV